MTKSRGLTASCAKSRAKRVEHVAGLMAAGEFRRGRTAKELATIWSMSLSSVHEICAEASRVASCAVNVSDVLRTYNESIDELIALAHECKEAGEHREAIVAFAKVAELCMLLARHRDGLPNVTQEDRLDTTKKLIAAGWVPPVPAGLPFPSVQDPENDPDAYE